METKILLTILELTEDGKACIIGNKLGGGNVVSEDIR